MAPITLAIVEDLAEVRETLKHYLDALPEFKVLGTYASAEEAIGELIDETPDIVIMDINLPGLSGIECIKQVKKKTSAIQFMMFTVYENDEKVIDALKAGASGYLLKKTGLTSIPAALKELFEGGAPMSSNIARKLISFFQQDKNERTAEKLTSRETEIIHLLAKGLLYKEIGDKLSITTGTVRQHIHNIYEKLYVQNRTEAINKLYKKS